MPQDRLDLSAVRKRDTLDLQNFRAQPSEADKLIINAPVERKEPTPAAQESTAVTQPKIPEGVEPGRLNLQEFRGEESQSLFSEVDSGLAVTYNNFARGIIQEVENGVRTASIASTGIINKALQLTGLEELEVNPQRDLLYQWADKLGQYADETFTDNHLKGSFLTQELPRAAASLVTQLGAGYVGGPLAAISVASTYSSQEYINALESTGDEDTAFNTFLQNLPVAGLSAFGAARFFRRFDTATGGGVKKILKGGFVGGIEEMSDEVASQWGTNVIARNAYDETRELTDGIVEGAGTGFALGFALNSIGLSMKFRTLDPNITKSERLQFDQAAEYALAQYDKLPQNQKGPLKARSPIPMQHIHLQRKYGWEPEVTRRTEEILVERYKNLPKHERGPVNVRRIAEDIDKTRIDRIRSDDPALGEFNQTNSDAILTDPAQTKNAFHKHWKKYWSPSGLFPRRVFRRLMKSKAMKEGEVEQSRINMRNLLDQVAAVYSPQNRGLFSQQKFDSIMKDAGPEAIKQIDLVLRGEEAPETIHVRLRKPVRDMRNHIDHLSRTMIDDGLIADRLMPGFKNNIGLYVHRRFRSHQSKEWRKEWRERLPEDMLNRAEFFIKDQYRKEHGREITDTELNNMMQMYASDTDARPGNIFMKREGVPEPIAALMGEVKEPFDNYALTIQKQATFISKKKFIKDVAHRFNGTYFFRPGDQTIPKGYTARISADRFQGMETIGDLDGMMTTPEILEAMQFAFSYNAPGPFIKNWMRLAGAPKYAKTVLNLTTHSRNVLGGAEFILRNGIIPDGPEFKRAWELTTGAYFNKGSAGDADRLMLTKLGLLRKSPRAGEVADTFRDMDLEGGNFVSDNLTHGVDKKGLMNKASKPVRFMTELYQAQDDFLRTLFFFSERARLRKADPKITDEAVAQRIIDTYQNYDQIPEGVKLARRFPLSAPFVSFPYEVIRTNFNTAKWARRELQSDNPEMRKIGAQRLMSQALSLSSPIIIGAVTRGILGMSTDEEDDRRRFFAPWDKNSSVAWVGSDGPISQHLNLSYTHPAQYLTDPLLTMAGRGNENDVDEQFIEGMRELFRPLLGKELLSSAIFEIASNKKSTGAQVYNPADDIGRRSADKFLHLAKVYEPGTLTSGRRFYEASTDEFTDKEVPTEILGLFGFRVTKLDIREGLSFKTRDYNKNRSDARRIYNSMKHTEGATPQQVRDAYDRANEANRAYFESFREDVDAARRVGVTWSEIEKRLTDAGLSKSQAEALRFGQYEPLSR